MSTRLILGNTSPGTNFASCYDEIDRSYLFRNDYFTIRYWINTPFSTFENNGILFAKKWDANLFYTFGSGTNRPGLIQGYVKDTNGNALSGCTVHLFATNTDVLYASAACLSNGSFDFSVPDYTTNYYLVAFSTADQTLAGTTVNTISGV